MKFLTDNSPPECAQVIPTPDGYTYCETGAPVHFYGGVHLCTVHAQGLNEEKEN